MKQLTLLTAASLSPGDIIILVNPAGQRLKGTVVDISDHSIRIALSSGGNYLVIGSVLYEGAFFFEFPAVSNLHEK